MRINEADEWKTAFQIKYDHFKYQVMPFGLSNAPVSFQGYINKIQAEKLNIFVIVYLNVIYTRNLGQGYMEVIQWVLDILSKNGLFANMKKCPFYKNKVRFLKYIVLSQNI